MFTVEAVVVLVVIVVLIVMALVLICWFECVDLLTLTC